MPAKKGTREYKQLSARVNGLVEFALKWFYDHQNNNDDKPNKR